jgi:hypothetical protein
MAIATRLYLSGVCAALVLCATAATFPEVPPSVMLGTLGGIFLTFASRTHRYARAHHEGDGRGGDPSTSRQPRQVSPPGRSLTNAVVIRRDAMEYHR